VGKTGFTWFEEVHYHVKMRSLTAGREATGVRLDCA